VYPQILAAVVAWSKIPAGSSIFERKTPTGILLLFKDIATFVPFFSEIISQLPARHREPARSGEAGGKAAPTRTILHGVLEWWSDAMAECWNIGIME
jgi:hypothetical protein